MGSAADIFISGCGAVSPAGWGVSAFREALKNNQPLPSKDLPRPGWNHPLRIRQTPAASPRPAFTSHARLRRTSPIAHYAVAAGLEALGEDAGPGAPKGRLGIVFCAMSGCVNYSRRFYDEVLKDPTTASPLVFPETVYNSPASHVAALLGTTAINYTLVGDPGTFIQGLVLAADWLTSRRVDGCLVIGAEEMDWLLADATHVFNHEAIVSDGAGAIYLKREPVAGNTLRLNLITDSHLFHKTRTRAGAALRVRREFLASQNGAELLCDSLQGLPRPDRDEQAAWSDWTGPRLSVKKILGEAFMAAAAWQCVAAVDALRQKQYSAATVSVVGCNQQAIAARFVG
jgi:hypothetical protein